MKLHMKVHIDFIGNFLWSFIWSFLWNRDFIGNFLWHFLWSFLRKLHFQAFVVKSYCNFPPRNHLLPSSIYPLLCFLFVFRFWPMIDDALRKAAIERKIHVKVMASWWNHSRSDLPDFLKSLSALSSNRVDIQVVSHPLQPLFLIVGWPGTQFGDINTTSNITDFQCRIWMPGPSLYGKLMLWCSSMVKFRGCHRHLMLFWLKIEHFRYAQICPKITWDVNGSP